MKRKTRKDLTQEIVDNIIEMMQTEKYSITEIGKQLQITRQTVGKVLKAARLGVRFMEAREKRKLTCQARNAQITEVDKIIFNTATKEIALTKQEITNRVRQQNGLNISRSTVSRILRKMNVNLKKPTKSSTIDSKIMATNIDNVEVVNNTKKPRRICNQNDESSTTRKDSAHSAETLMPCSMENSLSNRRTSHVEVIEDGFNGFPSTPTNDYNENADTEELMNIENDLDVIQDLMPRSKQVLKLQQELAEVEMKYYRNKTLYLSKLNENSKYKQTLMLLQSRKLQLEIEKMQNH